MNEKGAGGTVKLQGVQVLKGGEFRRLGVSHPKQNRREGEDERRQGGADGDGNDVGEL